MESTKIDILCSFSLISNVMPYFGAAHSCFLLLSKLCSNSRKKLDEFYTEFVICMRSFAAELVIRDDSLDQLGLPSDLFKFRIELKSLKACNEFIEYLRSYNTRTGSFFNSNFMHEQLLISQLLVDDKVIEIFISHKELLKSIPILSYSHYDKLSVKCTFNDAVVIKRVRLLDTVIITI